MCKKNAYATRAKAKKSAQTLYWRFGGLHVYPCAACAAETGATVYHLSRQKICKIIAGTITASDLVHPKITSKAKRRKQ